MRPTNRWIPIAGAWLVATLMAVPASAQIVQSLHVGFGGFFPRGFDIRTPGDTLVADLSDAEPLAFQIGRFRSGQAFGEWNVQFGKHIELGGGVSYYSDHVPSVYANKINADGSEIEQSLGLRMVPVTGVVRFLPWGTPRTAQPYVGVGVSAIRWRYAESGQFLNPDDSIYTDRFIATGTSVGPVALIGLRAPVGGDIYALTMEWRYQFAKGNTGGLAAGFLGDKIDLGGGSLNFGFLVRF